MWVSRVLRDTIINVPCHSRQGKLWTLTAQYGRRHRAPVNSPVMVTSPYEQEILETDKWQHKNKTQWCIVPIKFGRNCSCDSKEENVKKFTRIPKTTTTKTTGNSQMMIKNASKTHRSEGLHSTPGLSDKATNPALHRITAPILHFYD